MANSLNEASISQGDYINNFSTNVSNGVGNLDLNNTIFNLDEENLTYITN